MPDADVVHTKLPNRYQKLYKQICEWKWSPEDLGHEALKPLKKDIQTYGNAPIRIIKQASIRFGELLSYPLFLSGIEWTEENEYLDGLGQKTFGRNKRGKNLAIKACKEMLQYLRCGGSLEVSQRSVEAQLIEKYFRMIFRARFEECAPQTLMHYLDVDPNSFGERLAMINPYLENGIKNLALQVIRSGSIEHIHIPRKHRGMQRIDLETDIFNI